MQQVGGTNRISFRAVYYTNDVLRLITVHPKFVKAIIVAEILRKRERERERERERDGSTKEKTIFLPDQAGFGPTNEARSRSLALSPESLSYPGRERESLLNPSSSFRAQGGAAQGNASLALLCLFPKRNLFLVTRPHSLGTEAVGMQISFLHRTLPLVT